MDFRQAVKFFDILELDPSKESTVAQKSKITRVVCFNDNSAHVQRLNQPEERVYEDLTFSTQLRLERFSWSNAYTTTINLIGGIAVFIRPVQNQS